MTLNCLREAGVGGSIPLTPTNNPENMFHFAGCSNLLASVSKNRLRKHVLQEKQADITNGARDKWCHDPSQNNAAK